MLFLKEETRQLYFMQMSLYKYMARVILEIMLYLAEVRGKREREYYLTPAAPGCGHVAACGAFAAVLQDDQNFFRPTISSITPPVRRKPISLKLCLWCPFCK